MAISPRILYVDDDQEGCDLMVYLLKQDYGFEVVPATDGQQARRFIEQEFFDLYLLDYCLPDTTATSLCQEIKNANPNAPIIVYSALDRDVDRAHAMKAGANFYFVKPEQIDMVGNQIQTLIAEQSQPVGSNKKAIGRKDGRRAACAHPRARIKSSGIV